MTTTLRDGLYHKKFYNGNVFIGDRLYTLLPSLATEHFVRIKNGIPYLADSKGEIIGELQPVAREGMVVETTARVQV